MQAVARLTNREALHLKCYKGEELIAILPLYENKLLGYRALVSPSMSYYQALNLWLPDNINPSRHLLESLHVSQLIAETIITRYKRVHFNLGTDFYDVRSFTWAGLKAKPLYTFISDLTGNEKTLADESKKMTRALKLGYTFAQDFRPKEFIQLSKELHDKKGINLGVSFTKLESFVTQLHEAGLLRQYNVYDGKNIVSSNILLSANDGKAYTVLLATNATAMKQGVSTLHSLKLIESLRNEFKLLDFCGANVQDVARFKAALGLQLRVFYQIHT